MIELMEESPSKFKTAIFERLIAEVKKKLVIRAGKRVLKSVYNDAQKKSHLKNQFKNKGGIAGSIKSKKQSAKKLKKTMRSKGSAIDRKRKKSLAKG